MFLISLYGNTGHGHYHDPSWTRDKDPGMPLAAARALPLPWPQWKHSPPKPVWPQGQQGSGQQHGLRWLSRPPASTQPLVPTGAWTSTQILAAAGPQKSSPHMTKSNYSEPHLVPLSERPMIDNCAKVNCHHIMT